MGLKFTEDRQRFWITIALLALVIWALILVTVALGTGASRSGTGEVVDSYQRANDLLHTILPLLTVALGYWFGVAGKSKAETNAARAQSQLNAVLDASGQPGLLRRARDAHPEAFDGAAPAPQTTNTAPESGTGTGGLRPDARESPVERRDPDSAGGQGNS